MLNSLQANVRVLWVVLTPSTFVCLILAVFQLDWDYSDLCSPHVLEISAGSPKFLNTAFVCMPWTSPPRGRESTCLNALSRADFPMNSQGHLPWWGVLRGSITFKPFGFTACVLRSSGFTAPVASVQCRVLYYPVGLTLDLFAKF